MGDDVAAAEPWRAMAAVTGVSTASSVVGAAHGVSTSRVGNALS